MNLFKSLGGQKDGAPKAKKRSGYYLELDEAAQAVEAAPEAAPAPVAAVAAAPEAAPAPTVDAPATESAPAPTAAAAKAALKASKASSKAEAAKAEAPAAEAPKAAPAPAVTPAGMTFAPKFLMPSTGGRRMPGPSMSPFMDMARQVGQPRQS